MPRKVAILGTELGEGTRLEDYHGRLPDDVSGIGLGVMRLESCVQDFCMEVMKFSKCLSGSGDKIRWMLVKK